VAAPLDRLTRFSALNKKVSAHSYINGTIGCAASHLAILEEALAKNTLVFWFSKMISVLLTLRLKLLLIYKLSSKCKFPLMFVSRRPVNIFEWNRLMIC
jgi:hypothetical protein